LVFIPDKFRVIKAVLNASYEFSQIKPKIRKFEDGTIWGSNGTRRPNSAKRMNNINKDLVTHDLVESIVFWQ
jgi:hypothetical protein